MRLFGTFWILITPKFPNKWKSKQTFVKGHIVLKVNKQLILFCTCWQPITLKVRFIQPWETPIFSQIDGWVVWTLSWNKNFSFLGYGCVRLGTVIHEMLHASGFWHEQSRPDRDEHVEIFWSNIQPGMEDNFARYSRAEVSTLSLPYDTDSVMHYSSTAFSRNGQYTIKPKK